MPETSLELATSIRTRKVDETIRLIQEHLDSIRVSDVATHTLSQIQSIPVYEAIRKEKNQSDYFCLGKGFGAQQSKASCLMEAAEMHFLEAKEISSAVRLSDLDQEAQIYRRSWPKPIQKREWIQEGARDSFVYPSTDVRTKDTIYLLEEDIFYLQGDKRTIYGPTTNGLASGNTEQEAIIHGLCELIERDALHRWGLRRFFVSDGGKTTPYSGTRISTTLETSLKEIFEAGYHVYITRLPTPHHCFVYEAGLIAGQEEFRSFVFQGWGAHPVEEIAMNRAIAESVQILAMHKAIQHKRVPEERLPGLNEGHRRATRELGNAHVFEKNLDRKFLELEPCLWQLWYGPTYEWKEWKQDSSQSEILQTLLESDLGFCTSINLAPKDFPFNAQLTICSNLSSPPGL